MSYGLNSLYAPKDIINFYSKLLLESSNSDTIGRDPRHGPYHIYGYLPDAH